MNQQVTPFFLFLQVRLDYSSCCSRAAELSTFNNLQTTKIRSTSDFNHQHQTAFWSETNKFTISSATFNQYILLRNVFCNILSSKLLNYIKTNKTPTKLITLCPALIFLKNTNFEWDISAYSKQQQNSALSFPEFLFEVKYMMVKLMKPLSCFKIFQISLQNEGK